jgi:hypothetical protein
MWQIPLIEGHTDIKLQKKYMMENIIHMNKEIKMNILNLVIMDIDDSAGTEAHASLSSSDLSLGALKYALITNVLKQGKNGLNINLDKLPEHVIQQIYDIICYRMEILNTPARPRSKIHFTFCDEEL